MAYQSYLQTNFTAGAWTPRLQHRSDLERWRNAAKTLTNAVLHRHGGVSKRVGTVHVAEVKDSSKAVRLIPFRVSSAVNYVIELGDLYMRFYKDHAQIESGGSAYEVATPWTEAQIDAVKFTQSADVMYLVHPSHEPRTLSRTSDTSWTLAEMDIDEGPFRSENVTTTTTITSSAATGSVTITASSGIFTSDHVGSVWKVRAQDLSAVGTWNGNVAYTAGDDVRSRGKVYDCNTGGTSGAQAPDHIEGDAWDGKSGASCEWTFLHAGYGVFEITGFTSATVVTATVVKQLPGDVVSGTSYKWSEGAFSDERGWPTSVGFFQERLVFGMGQTLYFSTSADFNNFSPTDPHGDVTFDAAVTFTISDDQVDDIRWLAATRETLVVGTTGSERTIGPQTLSEPFGADNVVQTPQTFWGVADFVRPVRVGEVVLYAERSGRRLHEMTPTGSGSGNYQSTDLSVLSEHLLRDGIFEMSFTQTPDPILWCLVGTGTMVAITYDNDQQVFGWHEHSVGGASAFVESVVSIPDPTESWDELWLLVSRTVNGSTVRYIEYQAAPYDTLTDVTDAVYTDSTVTYDSTATTTITGLTHLEGETVQVLADGQVHDEQTVASGQITLDYEASTVQVGLGYTCTIKPIVPDPGSDIGQGQGKKTTIVKAYVRFLDTIGATYGTTSQQDTIPWREPGDAMNSALTPFTGIKEVVHPGSWEYPPDIVIQQTGPLPCHVLGCAWDLVVSNR